MSEDLEKFEVTLHGARGTQVRYVLSDDAKLVNHWAYSVADILGYGGWEILGEKEFESRTLEGDESLEFTWPADIENLEDGRLAIIIPTITEEYIAQQQTTDRQQILEKRKKEKEC